MNDYNIMEFEKLDSTNKYMKENLDRLSPFDVVRAIIQTAGYGRMQRSWYDNSDNLSFSILLQTEEKERLGLITQLAAASVVACLSDYGINAEIKWPNDVLVNRKKICGILVETVLTNDSVSVILGIGLNLNNQYFTDDLKRKATSVYLESNKLFDMNSLLNNILVKVDYFFHQFTKKTDEFMSVVRQNSLVIGKSVTLFEGETVIVEDIDELGRLVINKNGKRQTYTGSELSLQNIYNS